MFVALCTFGLGSIESLDYRHTINLHSQFWADFGLVR